jgi:SAM-dependent methyltransferase
MVINKCPLCSSTNYKDVKRYGLVKKDKYTCKVVRCLSCGHFFSIANETYEVNKIYSEGQYVVVDTRKTIFDKILMIDDLLIIRSISKLKNKRKDILDFGCGKGRFLKRIQTYGWKVKGVETAKERASFASKVLSLDISTNQYEKGAISGSPFSVITIFHVLEHLPRPSVLLDELIENNLSKDGLAVIEVPLFGSLQSRIAGKYWIHLDPPYHISHFTKKNILNLTSSLNLKPIKFEYLSLHLGILGMTQSVMSLFGYRKMLISELKFRKTPLLIAAMLIILPFALILEVISILFKSGGTIRVYCKKSY